MRNTLRIARGLLAGRTVGQVRCVYYNMGDILVNEAIDRLLYGVNVVTFGENTVVRAAETLTGFRRTFRYGMLGGGTLIFTPRNVGWLDALERLLAGSEPLCTFGTGVADPEFTAGVYAAEGRVSPLDDESIQGWLAALRLMPVVAVRGVESERILRGRGLDRVEVIGDPALVFAQSEIRPKTRRKRVGVNILAESTFWPNSKEHALREMEKFVGYLVKDGWEPHLLPATASDLEFANRLSGSLGPGKIEIHPAFTDPFAYMAAVETMDVFVGMRLHSYVAACCTNTPGLMVGYRPKCLDFTKTIGLERFHTRTDEVDADALMASIRSLYESIDATQRELVEKCGVMKANVESFAARIREQVAAS